MDGTLSRSGVASLQRTATNVERQRCR